MGAKADSDEPTQGPNPTRAHPSREAHTPLVTSTSARRQPTTAHSARGRAVRPARRERRSRPPRPARGGWRRGTQSPDDRSTARSQRGSRLPASAGGAGRKSLISVWLPLHANAFSAGASTSRAFPRWNVIAFAGPRSSCSVWTPTTRRLRSCRPLGGRLEVPLEPPSGQPRDLLQCARLLEQMCRAGHDRQL